MQGNSHFSEAKKKDHSVASRLIETPLMCLLSLRFHFASDWWLYNRHVKIKSKCSWFFDFEILINASLILVYCCFRIPRLPNAMQKLRLYVAWTQCKSFPFTFDLLIRKHLTVYPRTIYV